MRADADLSPAGMAEVVAAFLAALDLREVTLVGNDSGGAVSQLVAVRYPERLGRLVLTNCDALEVFPPKGFGYLSWVARIPGAMFLVARAMLHIPRLQRLPMAYGALTMRPLPDATLRQWVEPAARDPQIRRDVCKFMRGISSRLTLDAARALERFDRPVLLVWGADDPFFTVALARRLAAHIPGARVQTIADATVFVPLDQPEAVAAHIARFSAETGRAAAPTA
jgi:pimeloyl-ACP methyl ester carboxylesterase